MAVAYDPPVISAAHPAPSPGALPEVRRISLQDLREVLAQGTADFLAIPTQLVFLCLLYPIVGFVAARATTGGLLPLLFPLLAGLSLMGPVLAVGLYELSRRRELGLPVSWLNAFDVLRSPALVSIAALGAVLLGVFLLWVFAARAIYLATIGPVVPDGVGAFLTLVLHTGPGHALILWGNVAGLVFAVVVLMLTVVSFPMLLDRNCSIGVAVRTSVRAVSSNPATMIVWGLAVAALLVLGSIPVFVGLAVTMPILGHATWHLYRRVVGT